MSKSYKLVVLDGFTMNPGDLSWQKIQSFGTCKIYNRTAAQETVERSKGADIVLTNKVVFNRTVLSQLPNLKYIAVTATGYNVIDAGAAKELGVLVSNVPAYSTDSVAQMVFAYILNYTQNVAHFNQTVKNGQWEKSKDFCYWDIPLTELTGKTIGIIGFGRIGRRVARIAEVLGMNVLVHSRTTGSDTEKIQFVKLKKLLHQSDFISLHCPLTAQTEHIINKDNINLMKQSAVVINTGRGGLVNESDLADALNSKQIVAAYVDVLSSEPPAPGNPLLQAKNCYITPHIAWATISARQRLMNIVAGNIESFIAGNPKNIVNAG